MSPEARPRIVLKYRTPHGKIPFDQWYEGLRDDVGKQAVTRRIHRMTLGNLGHCDDVGEGVWGLKIDVGPGYRAYFGQDGQVMIILLCGGEKHGQQRDIAIARAYWRDYKNRKTKGLDK